MPELANIRDEEFCQRYVIHGHTARAYREAGYTGLRCTKLQQPDILARIEELRAEIRERNQWDKDRIIANLAAIAESDPGTIVKVDENGKLVVDYKAIKNLRGATVDVESDGSIRIKFEASARTNAVKEIAKICGLGTTQRVIHEYANVSDAELLAECEAEGIVVGSAASPAFAEDEDPA